VTDGAATGETAGDRAVTGGAAADGPGTGRPAAGEATGEADTRSPRVRLVTGTIAFGVALLTAVHLGFVFLHVAPENRISREHAARIDDWVYPYFEQNWKLFAPNPLAENVRVQARLRVPAGGGTTETDWYDLTGQDIAAIRGNPFPSKADQNLLRRAWDYYSATHGADESRVDDRGAVAEEYLRRIVVGRLSGLPRPVAVQIRVRTIQIGEPGAPAGQPVYRELAWWETTDDDFR
jgi:hypothetical protein